MVASKLNNAGASTAMAAVLWSIVLLLSAAVAFRYLGPAAAWSVLLLDMFAAYLWVPLALVPVVALAGRRWRLAGISTSLLLVMTVPLVQPMLRGPLPAAQGDGIRVMSANLLMVHPDPGPLLDEVLSADADVLLLQEYSSRWQRALIDAGVHDLYPHHRAIVREDSFGSAIFSRFPLEDSFTQQVGDLPMLGATVQLDTGSLDLFNVHTLPPRISEYVARHADGLAVIEQWIVGRQEQGRSFLVAGDFNATGHSRLARRIRPLAHDAWELAGNGPGATFPNGLFPLPPLRLDHIYLSKDLTVTDVRVGVGAGSDHRPLLATVARAAAFSPSPTTSSP